MLQEVKVATYLLTWNPDRWRWTEEEVQEDIANLEVLGPEEFQRVWDSRWSIGTNYRRIQPGDRLFLTRLGQEPRGIFASGYAASYPYQDDHWDEEEGHIAWYVDVYWDTLLSPYDPRLMILRDDLEFISAEQRWSPIASGEEINDDVAANLEAEWQRLTGASSLLDTPSADADDAVTLPEGAVRQTSVTRYERNRAARRLCIKHHGVSCTVCDFNFEKKYGEVGQGYIEVHHLTPISQTRAAYDINPIEDMRPICPNCHAMVHQNSPPYTIEEIREMIIKRLDS
jgi:5-methylcytosine-specific restriction enzyme A